MGLILLPMIALTAAIGLFVAVYTAVLLYRKTFGFQTACWGLALSVLLHIGIIVSFAAEQSVWVFSPLFREFVCAFALPLALFCVLMPFSDQAVRKRAYIVLSCLAFSLLFGGLFVFFYQDLLGTLGVNLHY